MNYYKLRIDISVINKRDVKELLQKYTTCYAYCYEGEDTNPHMHMYIEMSTKEATFRANLRKLGLKGNGSYSLKELDSQYPIEYLAYMMKEGRFKSHGIPDTVLAQALEYNTKVVDDIKAKKAAKRRTIDCLLDKYDEIVPNSDGVILPWDVLNMIIQYHIDNKIMIRDFQIVTYYHTVCCIKTEGHKESYQDMMWRKINNSI